MKKFFFVLIFFFLGMAAFRQAYAVSYNASNELGAPTLNDTPVYNRAGNNVTPQGFSYSPAGIVFDSVNHRLFIADSGDCRILVFPLDSNNNLASTTPSYVIGSSDFYTITCDTTAHNFDTDQSIAYDPVNQRLFAADYAPARVLIFNVATSTIRNGEDASYVLGEPDLVTNNGGNLSTSTFNGPVGVAYDASSTRLFVGDSNNNRVMIFNVSPGSIANGENASYVLGQPDFASNNGDITTSTLSNPEQLSYDNPNHRLFVADQGNDRVMIFNVTTSTVANGEDASYVIGDPDFVTNSFGAATPSTFGFPAPAYDSAHQRLFVADSSNSRVLVFNVATSTIRNGEDASYELGDTDFFGTSANNTHISFSNPNALGYDPVQSKLVISTGGPNLIVFNVNPVTIMNGENASSVIGEYDDNGNPDFDKFGVGNTPNAQLFEVAGGSPAVDPVNHRFFVSDVASSRILIFPLDANDNVTTRSASNVIGQPNLSVGVEAGGPTARNTVSNEISGLAYDSANSRLFAADTLFHRVLVYNVATSTFVNGENASYVLGQINFTSSSPSTTQSTLNTPLDLAYDPLNSRLFVADGQNNRVMVFNVATSSIANGENASYVIGQPDFVTNTGGIDTSTIDLVNSVAYDASSSRLFVEDGPRTLVFNVATSTIKNGEDASYVIGQPDFFTDDFGTTRNQMAPQGVSYDSVNQRLFFADFNSSRVMIFNVATSTIKNGEDASAVLGQVDFTTDNGGVTTQDGFSHLDGLTYDTVNQKLFVADLYNNRIIQDSLIKITTPSLPNGTVNSSYSQTLNTTSSQGTVSFVLKSGLLPPGLSLNTSSGLISGTPSSATTTVFTVAALDSFGDGSILVNNVLYTLQTSAATGISASPSTVNAGTTGNSIVLTGVSTSWIAGTPGAPIFTLSGGTGAAVTAQTVTSPTSATLTLSAGSSAGALTVTDPGTGATTTVTVAATTSTAPQLLSAIAGNAQVFLSWSVPSSIGGSALTQYLVYDRFTGSSTFIQVATTTPVKTTSTITSLTNGQSYDFEILAQNGVGTSTASNIVSSTPVIPTAPSAPTGVSAAAGNGQATVSFSAGSNGGSAILFFTAVSSPDGIAVSSTGSPIIVSGLKNGTAYAFTVTATNGIGTSSSSSPSSPVTPQAPAPGSGTVVNVPAGGTYITGNGGGSGPGVIPPPTLPAGTTAAGSSNTNVAGIEAAIASLTAQLDALIAQAGAQGISISSITGSGSASSHFIFTQNLLYGMTNSTDVYQLQLRLRSEGLFNHALTFYFGPVTLASVKAYQAKYGVVPVSGFVGPLTRAVLNR